MPARSPRASSRDAILRVFAEHVADRGYADTSLADIATELDLSKGTIVHHFGSKETLLREGLHRRVDQRRRNPLALQLGPDLGHRPLTPVDVGIGEVQRPLQALLFGRRLHHESFSARRLAPRTA